MSFANLRKSGTLQHLKKPGFAAVAAVLILAEVVSAFELSMMYVTLPTLIREFHVDASTVAWVVTAYLLVSASAGVMAATSATGTADGR